MRRELLVIICVGEVIKLAYVLLLLLADSYNNCGNVTLMPCMTQQFNLNNADTIY